MSDIKMVLMVVVTTAIIVVGGILLLTTLFPPRVMTCSDYSNFPRERVPARCFQDFQPERR